MSSIYRTEVIDTCLVNTTPTVRLGNDLLTSYLVGDKLYFYISRSRYNKTGKISISVKTVSGGVIDITTKDTYNVSDLIRECVRLKGLINISEVELGAKEYAEYLSHDARIGNLIIRNIGGTLI